MNYHPRRIFLVPVSLALAMLFASCDPFTTAPRIFNPVPDYRIVEPDAVVPKSFLYNPDRNYNAWMDTPLRVNYHKVSLQTIFCDTPFRDFRHELRDIPHDIKPLTIDALGHTRRQLLWGIAHDNNLKMILLTTPGGRPSVVIIRWRGNRATNQRGSMDR